MQVSIIIPIYKTEKYLRQCIDSILNQTFKDFEVILVDDGSPDNCPTICDEYANQDTRIKVIHKENGGPSSSVNEGIKQSTGKYITFSDSDDWLEETYIEELYNAIIKEDADISICDIKRQYKSYTEIIHSCNLTPGIYLKDDIKTHIIPYLINVDSNSGIILNSRCAKMFKRDILMDNINLFFENCKWGEDKFIIMSCVIDSSKIIYLNNRFLYNYRTNENSLMNTYSKDFFEEIFNFYNNTKKIAIIKKIDYTQQLYYQYINCLIDSVDKISQTIGIYEKKIIFIEIEKIINSKEVKELKIEKDKPLNLKQKIYIFLLKNKMPYIIYLLLYYLYKKNKFINGKEK